jgi:hypothetical protein
MLVRRRKMVMVVGRILRVPDVGEETRDGRKTRAGKTADSRGGLVEEKAVSLVHERELVVVVVMVTEKVLTHVPLSADRTTRSIPRPLAPF